MFFAALMSRSCRVPQDGHCHIRVPRLSSVDGSIEAGSIPGQDQVNASGASIFARYSAPSRYRNPDRVYSADCRPLRDLNRGYRARLAKNAVNAACWWRIAYWSGTEDTSFSQAGSSVAFMAVR
jgi:hypothetical protein